jgi:hypothetical protein
MPMRREPSRCSSKPALLPVSVSWSCLVLRALAGIAITLVAFERLKPKFRVFPLKTRYVLPDTRGLRTTLGFNAAARDAEDYKLSAGN